MATPRYGSDLSDGSIAADVVAPSAVLSALRPALLRASGHVAANP
jgi:hypothetical protein